MLKPSSQSERSGQEGYQPMPAELGWTRGPSKASYFSSTGIADANVVTISLSAAGSRSTQQIFGGLGAPRARTAAGRRLSSPQAAAVEHLTLLPSGDQLLPHPASALLDVSSLKNSPGWQPQPGRGGDPGCRSLVRVVNSPPVPVPGQSTAELAATPPAPQRAGQQGHGFYLLLIRK